MAEQIDLAEIEHVAYRRNIVDHGFQFGIAWFKRTLRSREAAMVYEDEPPPVAKPVGEGARIEDMAADDQKRRPLSLYRIAEGETVAQDRAANCAGVRGMRHQNIFARVCFPCAP